MVHWGQAHIRLMLAKTIHSAILLVIAYNVCLSTAHIHTQGHTQTLTQGRETMAYDITVML